MMRLLLKGIPFHSWQEVAICPVLLLFINQKKHKRPQLYLAFHLPGLLEYDARGQLERTNIRYPGQYGLICPINKENQYVGE